MTRMLALGMGGLLLSGCGAPVTPLTPPATPARAAELSFTPVPLEELATRYNRAEHEGRLVRFAASFAADTWTYAYGMTTFGYKLWDRAGHALRCSNIVYERRIDGWVTDRDLRPEARWLLVPGTYVQLEGRYSPSRWGSAHGGTFMIEPSVDVYTINGRPTRDYVR